MGRKRTRGILIDEQISRSCKDVVIKTETRQKERKRYGEEKKSPDRETKHHELVRFFLSRAFVFEMEDPIK